MAVGTAAVPAPAPPPPPPLGRPQDPDPRPGRRVSIHPQPTRAPRDEAMALGPLRGRELARAVAKGPALKWGSGGMAGGKAAAALWLPLAPGVTGTATDPPPPRGAKESEGLTGDVHCLTGEQGGRGTQQPKASEAPHPGLPALAPDPTEALDVTLCLHAAARPRRLTKAWVVKCNGGGNATALSGTLPDTPGAAGGGYGSGTSPGDPRLGEAPGSAPPAR